MSLVTTAALLADELHSTQVRKDGATPYIWHPMRVAGLVTLESSTDAAIAAAWLHDTLEDTPITADRLLNTLCTRLPSGDQTEMALAVEYVVQLTNPSSQLQHRKLPRDQRKKMDREHIARGTRTAQLIKLCDRLDNFLDDMKPEARYLHPNYARETRLLLDAIACIPTSALISSHLVNAMKRWDSLNELPARKAQK